MSFIEFEAIDGSPVLVNTDHVYFAQPVREAIGVVALVILPHPGGQHVMLAVKGAMREVFGKLQQASGAGGKRSAAILPGLTGVSH